MLTVGMKTPDHWNPVRTSGARELYLRKVWYLTEGRVIRGVYPDDHAGRNAVTVGLIRGPEEADETYRTQVEKLAA